MNNKPWDARIAARLVRPLVQRNVHPNALTTLRLVVGIIGAMLFASGSAFNLGAWFIVCSNFLDHTDGELARMSGKTSRFGHLYDLTSDLVVTSAMFVGLGIGLRSEIGDRSILFGVIAGVAVAGIFHLRHLIEQRHGKSAVKQASAAGFDAEDILYLIPLVTVTEMQSMFLMAATVGAPIALLVVVVQFLRQPKATTDSP